MKTAVKSLALIVMTILTLSITVRDRTIFEHIYSVISPATRGAQSLSEELVTVAMEKTGLYGRKLFDNSVPKVKDSVKSKVAAPIRKTGEPLEEVSDRDKQQLDQLIKTHR